MNWSALEINWSFKSDFIFLFLFSHPCSLPFATTQCTEYTWNLCLCLDGFVCVSVKVSTYNTSHIDTFYKLDIFPFSDLERFLGQRPGACSDFLLWILLIMMCESSMTLKILHGCTQAILHRKMWSCAIWLTQGPTKASIPPFPTGVFWGEVYKRILEREDEEDDIMWRGVILKINLEVVASTV